MGETRRYSRQRILGLSGLAAAIVLALGLGLLFTGARVAPSPITVADGSMKVQTKSDQTLAGGALTIKGGKACKITNTNGRDTILGTNWTLTSNVGQATISTTDGATIVATVNAATLNDAGKGKGAEFGKQAVVFSPAKLDNPSTTISCTPNPCTIAYKAACP